MALILESTGESPVSIDAAKSLALSPEAMTWWRDAKFGMFIHWGVYAIAGRGEWLMWNERIPFRDYAKFADQFTPGRFDANAWAATAKAAGMKYMVLTTRHHDGFCLFDSKASDFTSVKTAAKRDFIAEYVTACRKAGLAVGFYYSPMDWRFPGFFFPDIYRESAEAMRDQTYAQIRELLTNYGKIDILWYDGGGDNWLGYGGLEHGSGKGWHSRAKDEKPRFKPLWEPEKLNAMVRELQPHIVINDRSGWAGDFSTPEHRIGEFSTTRPWETCDMLANTWGWVPDSPMLSFRSVVQMLVKAAVGDGNLLLNVGPTADGEIEDRQVNRLREVGEWLKTYGRTIYGTRGGPIPPKSWGGVTHRGNSLFVHVLDWTEDHASLPALGRRILKVSSLTGAKVAVEESSDGIRLSVPAKDRDAIDTVVELELDASL